MKNIYFPEEEITENYIPALGPERTQNLMDVLFSIGFYWLIGVLVAGVVRAIYRRLRLRRHR